MHDLSIADVNFHDALLLALTYSQDKQRVIVLLISFLEKGEEAKSIRLDFRGVSFLLCTNSQPWGPSQYINMAVSVDQAPCGLGDVQPGQKMLHIQMQSGDDIYISFNAVAVSQEAVPASDGSGTNWREE